MQKMTLLEMTQNILSAIDSDEVNSITDTVEALQVAEIIKETFYEQFNGVDLPEFEGLIKLESLSDVNSPNYLRLPSNLIDFSWVRYRDYRNNNRFKDLFYLTPEEFLDRLNQYSNESSNVMLTTDPVSEVQYYINTNQAPTFYTMFGDNYLATNSFDQDNESVLQSTNSYAFGHLSNEFEMEDDYIPPLDSHLFPLLLAEAKSTAFINLKQISSSKEEQRARRQRIRMAKDRWRNRVAQKREYYPGPNYARNR